MKRYFKNFFFENEWKKNYNPILQEYLGTNISFKEWKTQGLGISEDSPTHPLIASITSRQNNTYLHAWLAIESLFHQTKKPDRLILNLPETFYPNRLDDVPVILKLQMKRGLEINFYPEKPGIVFNQNATIVTFSDEWVYPAHTLNTLWQTHIQNPQAICVNWACQIPVNTKTQTIDPVKTWSDIQEPGTAHGQNILCMEEGGILYPHDPTGKTDHGLHPSVTNEMPEIFKNTPTLWCFLKRLEAETPVVITKNNWANNLPYDLYLSPTAYPDHWKENIDAIMAHILKEYPHIKASLFDNKKTPVFRPVSNVPIKKTILDHGQKPAIKIIDQAKSLIKKIIAKDITRIPYMAQYDWDPVVEKSCRIHDETLPSNIKNAASDVLEFRRIFDRYISINGDHYNLEAFKKKIQQSCFKYLPYAEVFKDTRLWEKPPQKPVGISVIAATNRPQDIQNIIANFKRQITKTDQHHFETELVLVPNGDIFDLNDLYHQVQSHPKEIVNRIRILEERCTSVDYLADAMNYGIQNATYDLVTKTDGDDIYGPNYLIDLMRYLWCTGIDLVGCRGGTQRTIVVSQKNGVSGRLAKKSLLIGTILAGGTLTFSKQLHKHVKFRGLGPGSDTRFLKDTEKNNTFITLTIPHFNYVRTRSKYVENHTCRTTKSFKTMHSLPILHSIRPGLPPKLDGLII